MIDGVSTFKSDGEPVLSTNPDGVNETLQLTSTVKEYQSASHKRSAKQRLG